LPSRACWFKSGQGHHVSPDWTIFSVVVAPGGALGQNLRFDAGLFGYQVLARPTGGAQDNDFGNAEAIRAHVRTAGDRGQQSIPSLKEWAGWAMSEADRLDPTKNGSLAAPVTAVANGIDLEGAD
jgi:hypothetical protein